MAAMMTINGYEVILDDADLPGMKQYQWAAYSFGKRGLMYAVATIDGKTTYMHRLIMGAGPNEEVDHLNNNGLDNRRQYLRVCSHQQNLCNQRKQEGCYSRFKGVTFAKRRANQQKPWFAQIRAHGRHINLGWFHTEEEAAIAYDTEASKQFGRFAKLNFPQVDLAIAA